MSTTSEASPSDLITVTPAQRSELTDLIAAAFDDDPAINWMVRQDRHRSAAIRLFFDVLIKTEYLQHRECYLLGDRSGATVWLPPNVEEDAGLWQTLRQLPAMIRVFRWRGLKRALGVHSLLEERHPKTPHYYLFAIGTDPQKRGQGIGSRLMRPMMERCDRENVPAYLENSKERNLPFYERHGFQVVDELVLPGGGPPIWPMWREPRS